MQTGPKHGAGRPSPNLVLGVLARKEALLWATIVVTEITLGTAATRIDVVSYLLSPNARTLLAAFSAFLLLFALRLGAYFLVPMRVTFLLLRRLLSLT